jgi:hypothetical protein
VAPGRIPTAWGEPVNRLLNPRFRRSANWGPSGSTGIIGATVSFARVPGTEEMGARVVGDQPADTNLRSVGLIATGLNTPVVAGEAYSVGFDVLAVQPSGDPTLGLHARIYWGDATNAIILTSLGPITRLDPGGRGRIVIENQVAPPTAVQGWAGVVQQTNRAGETIQFYGFNAAFVRGPAAPRGPLDGSRAGARWQGAADASYTESVVESVDPFEAYPRAAQLIDSIPPAYREDPDMRAVMYVHARESLRQEETLDALLADLFATRATDRGLRWLEALLRLSIAPADLSLEERRGRVLAAIRKGQTGAAGSEWVRTVTDAIGPGWTYYEYVAGGQPPPAGQRTNAHLNPSGESAGGEGWGSSGNVAGGLPRVSTAGIPTRGTYAMQRTTSANSAASGDTAGVMTRGTYLGVPVVAGEVWSMAADVYVPPGIGGDGARFRYRIYHTDGTTTLVNGPPVGPFTASARKQIDGILIPANGGYLVAEAYATATAAGQNIGGVAMDALLVERAPVAGAYFDGGSTGAAWTGAANLSPSVTPPTPANPPANTVRIEVPFAPAGGAYARALSFIREITPAHLDIQLFYAGGFVLDESALDAEGIG